MKISTWRPAIVSWLGQKISIDSWLLDNPQIGLTHAFVPPLRDVNYTTEQLNSVRGYGIQDIIIVRRYPKTIAYNDLPIAAMEGLHCSLSVRLATEVEDIADLTRLEVLTVADPVHLEEMGDRLGDWILRLHWAFSITFYAEVEDPTGVPIEIKGIDLGIYRENLDGTESVLDYEVSL